MTGILIKEINISYFKGIKHLALNLDSNNVSVYGDNGTGKSTICDAILWVLFGRNSEGSTQFSIKTLDSNGKVIPNVRHSVKLSLSINETIRDIEKVYVEEKVMRRGKMTDEIKHSTEYYIDGESYTKRDYEKFISDIIDEATFKAVTDPRYFPSLHWKDQRAFLEKLAGTIDYSKVESQSRFNEITHLYENKTAEEIIQHLSYNIKQVKEKMESIPARIEEVNNTCPEGRDWKKLKESEENLSKMLETVNSRLYALQHNSEDASLAEIRRKLEFANRRLDEMRKSAYRMEEEANREYNINSNDIRNRLNARKSNLNDMMAKASSLMVLIKRAEENLDDIIKRKESLQDAHKKLIAKKKAFRVSNEQLSCPTCGRIFEGDEREKAIENIKQNFIANFTADKEEIQKQFDKEKEYEADAQAIIASYRAEAEAIKTEGIVSEIDDIEKELSTLVKPKTAVEILEANPSYKSVSEEAKQLQSQLDNPTSADKIAVLQSAKEDIERVQSSLNEVKAQLAEKATYDKCKAREKELECEYETLSEQLDSLAERKEIATEYQQECDMLLENTVNSKFEIVSFRLFDTLNDGTRKPFCEAWVNGVPFSDLNSAMKINAGLDILNTIADYYDCYAPVLIDNAESTNNIIRTIGQQIRLYVSNDSNLTIR